MSRKQFKDYIRENISVGDTIYNVKEIDEFAKWWTRIEKDCKHWLREMTHNNPQKRLAFRGRRGNVIDFDLITTRTDRRPKDMSPDWHQALDDAFKDMFGWKPRSEGVFVAAPGVADSYGALYMVFPIGKYKYLWSEVHADLYSYINDDLDSSPDDYTVSQWEEDWEERYGEGGDGEWEYDGRGTGYKDKEEAIDEIVQEERSRLEDKLDSLGDDDEEEKNSLQDEIDNLDSSYRREIEGSLTWEPAMSWDSYSDMQSEDYSGDSSTEQARDVVENASYQTDNIIKGIEDRKEIMIGCKEYYVIHNKFKPMVTAAMWDKNFSPYQLTFDFNKEKEL